MFSGVISQVFERLGDNSDSKDPGTSSWELLMHLEKDNERLRIINQQLNTSDFLGSIKRESSCLKLRGR